MKVSFHELRDDVDIVVTGAGLRPEDVEQPYDVIMAKKF